MTRTYQIIISPRSLTDLTDIHTFISKDSPQNADRVIEVILNAIEHLEILPQRFPVYQGRHRPSEAVRRMPVTPFLVYYRINESKRSVEVVTVRHGQRRQPRSF